jgi:hypothetical protein
MVLTVGLLVQRLNREENKMPAKYTKRKMASEGPKGSRSSLRPQYTAARKRATSRAQARTRNSAYPLGRPKVQEAGVGNLAMTAIRAGMAIAKSGSKAAPAARLAGSSKTGVSKVTGGMLKNGKPAKYGPKNKTLTPAQKSAQTRAMNRWKAENAKGAASEGPKKKAAASAVSKSASAKTSKVTGKRIAGGTVAAGAGAAAGYGTYKAATKRSKYKTNKGGSSSSRGEWTGTGYRK